MSRFYAESGKTAPLEQGQSRFVPSEEMSRREFDRELVEAVRLAKEVFVLFLEPPSIDENIVNQYALFSVMASPTARLDDWLRERPDFTSLNVCCFRVSTVSAAGCGAIIPRDHEAPVRIGIIQV